MLITGGPDFMQLKVGIKIRIVYYEVSAYLMELKTITQSYKLILFSLLFGEFFSVLGIIVTLLLFANRIKWKMMK